MYICDKPYIRYYFHTSFTWLKCHKCKGKIPFDSPRTVVNTMPAKERDESYHLDCAPKKIKIEILKKIIEEMLEK